MLIHYPETFWTPTEKILQKVQAPHAQLDRLTRLFEELEILYLGDLVHITEKKLLSCDRIGPKTVKALNQALREFYGYQLGMVIERWEEYRISLYPNLLHEIRRHLERRSKPSQEDLKHWLDWLIRVDYRQGNKHAPLEETRWNRTDPN
jgi:hypothetical protein